MTTRRTVLRGSLGGLVLAGAKLFPPPVRAESLPGGALTGASLESLAGKQPLIRHTYRPPNYETPVADLGTTLTANDRFFVRWHMSNIPEVSSADYRLEVAGASAAKPMQWTLDELRANFERSECVAVCQCAGNRRGYSDPHVPGVQWGSGAVGNARWVGARLRDVLNAAGLKGDALEVAFAGSDRPPLEQTPSFVKSLPLWKAIEEHTLIAYEMNGAPLPHWNGAPARLIVPGWAGTYWVKQLARIEVRPQPLGSFWMTTAYRIPKGKFPIVERFSSQDTDTTSPLTELAVNSLITSPADGATVPFGRTVELRGIAWDGGFGIRLVEVSTDDGRSWQAAALGENLGRYSFRPWQLVLRPRARGVLTVLVRASNVQGTTQPFELLFNGAGYLNNVVQQVQLHVA
jgi:DMSO/TMAO reductase YedYZ molybdopterin-dependent catalytic subunit